MRNLNWTCALLIGGALLMGGGAAIADETAAETAAAHALKVVVEEGQASDGSIAAIRVRTEGQGSATCGETEGVEFRRVRQVTASRTQPVEYEPDGLDCTALVEWTEGEGWSVQVGPGDG